MRHGRKVWLGILLALLVSASTAAAREDAYESRLRAELADRNPAAAVLFAQAEEARQADDPARAEALFGQVLELVPGYAPALRRRGWAVLALGRRDEALALCREALEREESPENRAALAAVLVGVGSDRTPASKDVEEGLGHARRALLAASPQPRVLESVSWVALRARDVDLLEEAVAELHEAAPDTARTWYFAYLLGMVSQAYDEAAQALERSRELGLDEGVYGELSAGLEQARVAAAAAPPAAGGPWGRVAAGAAWFVVFLLSVTFHEAAHAWTAKRGGDLTAYKGGQVSLGPWAHIRREPFGMVVLPLLSIALMGWPFGYASTPYDPGWAARHPRRAAWMALSGPGANLGLLLASAVAIRLGVATGWFVAPASVGLTRVALGLNGSEPVAYLLSLLFSLNLILFVLNLIPLPPLDGAGGLPLLIGESLAGRFRGLFNHPTMSWVGLLVVWRVFDPLFPRIFLAALNLLYPGAAYG